MINRRKFLGTAALAGAFSAVPFGFKSNGADFNPSEGGVKKAPNSKFGGVQIGVMTYSWRDLPSSAADIIKYCQDSGVNSVELMGDVIESYAGLPPGPKDLSSPLPPEAQARLDKMQQTFKISLDQLKKYVTPSIWNQIVSGIMGPTEEQKTWRINAPMTKFEELRKMFDYAGVKIHIAKLQPSNWSDGEIDYAFKVAKTLGAKGITDEGSVEAAKRLGPFAEKYGLFAIFHNHAQYADKNFSPDPILAASPANMLNLDCGHYFGSTGLNPADFIKKYHDRIVSLHLKDKTGPNTKPPDTNEVWGQGQVPFEDILLLLKDHAKDKDWPKYGDIELEYPIAAWSNPVKEVKTCVAYTRQILI
ncbi:MAG TPA: sugar phosphate isomerase/epimerase [Mucilaginibacter sp.]|jgi:sugar phosphate isomerase/epimerase|nr:sugar phosphate isomerase/epimerase [Mucilaginibacter sp.]